ncbi:hypothetical protein DPMN_115863 [Dreissena polymorpha]|uniref:Uncharacterized protein n=1 Tax=Dreissena polymorpha TaxID=45954 RepID=A0A9D4KNN4_DREPO|nr:hypothetical protein DPMN_115863 [Dreissena polymorpha]
MFDPGLVMGPWIVEINCIVIRQAQYQFEVNRCRNEEVIVKGNFGWVWPMWAGRLRVGNGAMHKVQYQLEVNRCRNEEIIVKGNFGGCGLCGRGAPGLVMGPCIVEIDRIVIREVQYQFEVNPCRNEDILVKSNFGWVCPMLAGRPMIDRIVIREVQYQFEVNPCRNEEIIVKGNFGWVWLCGRGAPWLVMGPCIVEIYLKGNFGWVWSMLAGRPRIDRIVIREVKYQFEVNRCRNEEVNFQGSSANSVGGDSGQDGRTDGGDNHNIPTLFKKRGDNYVDIHILKQI